MTEPGYEQEFEVRDLRTRGRYFIDNEFYDTYAKLVGKYGVLAYNGLCRHANKKGEAWPSQKSLAEKLGLNRQRINEGIQALLEWNIITIDCAGVGKRNQYLLIDKKYWKAAPVSAIRTQQTTNKRSQKTP